MTLLEGLALLPLAFWLLLTLDRGRRWPWVCTLPEAVGERAPVEGNIVAVVPARDEAALLPATLRSLLGQEIASLRVILVDDGSTDGTAEVARAVARETGDAPSDSRSSRRRRPRPAGRERSGHWPKGWPR